MMPVVALGSLQGPYSSGIHSSGIRQSGIRQSGIFSGAVYGPRVRYYQARASGIRSQLEGIATTDLNGPCPEGTTTLHQENPPDLCIPPAGLRLSNGDTIEPDGTVVFANGSKIDASGNYTSPSGSTVAADGTVTHISGSDSASQLPKTAADDIDKAGQVIDAVASGTVSAVSAANTTIRIVAIGAAVVGAAYLAHMFLPSPRRSRRARA